MIIFLLLCMTLPCVSVLAAFDEKAAPEGNVTITILYDNTPFDKKLTNDWGFACLIKGLEKTVLFDTGAKGDILLDNMKKLGIDPKEIDIIVLSHSHRDHTGGLEYVLKQNGNVDVFIPSSFFNELSTTVRTAGGRAIEVKDAMQLFPGCYSTGELTGPAIEQALYFESDEGIVLITGCAHPSVENLAARAAEVSSKSPFFVLGGFHLGSSSDEHINNVIKELKRLGVRKVLPTHCSGENAIRMFKAAFGEGFIEGGLGSVLTVSDR